MKGGRNVHMLPFSTQALHLICFNLPLGIETVHGMEDNTRFLHCTGTSDGEGDSNLLTDMAGNCWLDWVLGETMEEWGSWQSRGSDGGGKD